MPVSANRIEIVAHVPFERLRQAFEREVPPLDEKLFARLVAEGADWKRFVQASGGRGIHSFVAFWRHYPSPVMSAGGSDTPSAAYVIGDYATTARMFRHDPGILLYAPLRLELHADRADRGDGSDRGDGGDRAGRTVLSVDQPSSQLVTFGNNKITQAGYELDRMLGDLLEELGLPRPSVLRR